MHSAVVVVVVSFAALSAGCTDTEIRGSARVCFASDSDGAGGLPLEGSDARSGLRLVDPDAATAPPTFFQDCAASVTAVGEFIDEDGAHLWLGLDALHDGSELIPPNIFSIVDDATLRIQTFGGFTPSASVALLNGDQPIIALQATADLDGDAGALQVERAGGTALASLGSCGSQTALGLRFIDDNGSRDASNGEQIEMIVGGVEFIGVNIRSIEHGASSCEDAPSSQSDFTWLAFDSSL